MEREAYGVAQVKLESQEDVGAWWGGQSGNMAAVTGRIAPAARRACAPGVLPR